MKKVISLFPTELDVGSALWRYAYFRIIPGIRSLMGVMATISLLSEGGDDVSAAGSPKFWKKFIRKGYHRLEF